MASEQHDCGGIIITDVAIRNTGRLDEVNLLLVQVHVQYIYQ